MIKKIMYKEQEIFVERTLIGDIRFASEYSISEFKNLENFIAKPLDSVETLYLRDDMNTLKIFNLLTVNEYHDIFIYDMKNKCYHHIFDFNNNDIEDKFVNMYIVKYDKWNKPVKNKVLIDIMLNINDVALYQFYKNAEEKDIYDDTYVDMDKPFIEVSQNSSLSRKFIEEQYKKFPCAKRQLLYKCNEKYFTTFSKELLDEYNKIEDKREYIDPLDKTMIPSISTIIFLSDLYIKDNKIIKSKYEDIWRRNSTISDDEIKGITKTISSNKNSKFTVTVEDDSHIITTTQNKKVIEEIKKLVAKFNLKLTIKED